MCRSTALTMAWVFGVAAVAGAQDARVDFRRDVLPIVRENCVGCHGPTQQMNGFRLDRRSVAMRGGTRTVIVPGSSESSRLYLRLIGNQFGNPMPPAGPLSAEAIATLKTWIDQGAGWPDDLANEIDLPPADPMAIRLIETLRAGDQAAFARIVDADPGSLNLRGPEGVTPFMASILYSDAATIAKLIEKGADVNHLNDAAATPLMWAATSIAKARVLLQHGADPNARSNDGRTPLLIAATQFGTAPVVRLLLEHGAKADTASIREAAAAGDFEVMRLLMDRGVKSMGPLAPAMESDCAACADAIARNLDKKGFTAALLAMSVSSRYDEIKFLLDRGADPNTSDGEGRTPLMNAANSDRMPLDTVKLLIERGANVNAKNNTGQTVLDMALLHGSSPIVDTLVKAGARPNAPPAPVFQPLQTNTIEAAIQRSLPRIQKADVAFMQKSGCTSCHNEGLPQMTVGFARATGFKVDESLAARQIEAVRSFFDGWRDRLLQGVAPGGVSYTLVSLHAMGYKPDTITDAIARDIRMHQRLQGNWRPPCGGSRAPHCGTETSNTALSLRALQLYGLKEDRADYDQAIQRAAAWLVTSVPESTEDRAFRLMGLVWAGQKKALIQAAINDVVANQRLDGGWSDVPTLPSGAYATGESLYALQLAGFPVTDPVYQRGVKYLLSTQLEDGSWYARTRSLAVQPYFDVGFPHGMDQWISVASTSWATMALAAAAPAPRPKSTAPPDRAAPRR